MKMLDTETFVLARIKRRVISLKAKIGPYSSEEDKYNEFLTIIAEEEANAVLGTEELAEELAEGYLKINEQKEN